MKDSITDKNKIRSTLLENGYRPLPLLDKGIRIKGWSRDTIDQAWLDQFKRNGKFNNTGIRCDDLIAFDIDVLDEALADQCEDLINEKCGYTDLCRVGQWPKRLLLYGLSDKAGRSARSGKYGGHQVELLCTHGRQFAAFGIHPGTGRKYDWLEGSTPLTTDRKSLPEISAALALQTLDALEVLLQDTGLAKTTPGGRLGVDNVEEYDLVDSLAVQLTNGSETTWGELRDTLTVKGVWGNLRREDNEFGDSNAIHFSLSTGNSMYFAHDFARDVTHWEPVVSIELGEALPDQSNVDMFTDQALVTLLDDYVLLADKTIRHIDHRPGMARPVQKKRQVQ